MSPSIRQSKLTQVSSAVALLDRDHSILAFNERVLDWAYRVDVPLLERLRYLCIVSSNLDEFFEVRAEPHLAANQNKDEKGLYSVESFKRLAVAAHTLVAHQYALYNDDLMPALEKQGIKIVSHGERNVEQRRWVKLYFEREVRPLLIPVGLDPSHPFPQVANKSLNFIVRLSGRDAFGRENEIAIVKVPRVLPRMIRMPERVCGQTNFFVSLSSVIRAHLAELFPGRDVGQFSQFRVTRHSDLAVDEDEVKNLRTALRKGLQHRNFGQAVRLEVSAGCSEYLSAFLLKQFELPEQALYRVAGPVNLVRLTQLVDLVDAPQLCFPFYKSCYPTQLTPGLSFFDQLKQGDVLIHQPFESFDGVLAFLREAVNDPNVLAIKQTIYRTGSDAALMDLLREGVRRGKEVTVVVELKARFDEEANINWAEMLESIGAQVLYGVVGLKTHAKMMLITRREGKQLKRYAHLSTGNYNPRTARLYTDWSHLTADPLLTADLEHVFVHLASHSRLPKLNRVLLAPFYLHAKLIEKINDLAAVAASGGVGRIVAKMNALTDETLIHALIRAGQKGVKIDLIVRGACMLPAQVPGLTDNIHVRSVIGRFLEHSRVFYFRRDEVEELYLSSADWMNRNMMRRVELAWPVTDPVQRQRIIDECLVAYLHDGVDAWDLLPDGTYARVKKVGHRVAHGAQAALMVRYAGQDD
ncbi:MAG: polyphosphate kinase 1 [Rhodoferax sp.]|uniref:polyphosphate kinase 1 n=1 Tax=Rhodoferax sp. TaxID=50421 RepID=UPI0018265A2C|nr:polyphosphate kinase 1 [Rhodoferax sp.]NMM15303.1 polyphosphate kinase 1 [Rhodoferax sp.]NMM21017.1 polyphosphate kinase 1 [Rhodoferax sp.]